MWYSTVSMPMVWSHVSLSFCLKLPLSVRLSSCRRPAVQYRTLTAPLGTLTRLKSCSVHCDELCHFRFLRVPKSVSQENLYVSNSEKVKIFLNSLEVLKSSLSWLDLIINTPSHVIIPVTDYIGDWRKANRGESVLYSLLSIFRGQTLYFLLISLSFFKLFSTLASSVLLKGW